MIRILAAFSWLVAALTCCCPVMWVGFARPRRRVYPTNLFSAARHYVGNNVSSSDLSDSGDAVLDRLAYEHDENPRGVAAELRRRRRGRKE